MKLKNAITLSAVALATAFTSGDLYAQKKKTKTKKVQEETVIGVQRGSNYGDPKDVKAEAGAFAIVPLKYKYFGLEEYIDEETMFIHFSKHYIAYLNNLNKAVAGTPQAQMSIEELLRTLDMNNATLRNNAGGYYNHNMYFAGMSPSGGNPKGALAAAIDRDFGSFDNFKKAFAEAGINIRWEGKSIDEKGIDVATGKVLVEVDPKYFRPAEVEQLLGDPTKAKTLLGWNPTKTSFDELIKKMVHYDLEYVEKMR